MMFVPVMTHEVEQQWPNIAETAWPAVHGVAGATMEGLRNDLISGRNLAVWCVGAEGSGLLILEIDDAEICWVKYGAARLSGGLREKLKVMREGMAWLEVQMAAIGCKEVRVCGRDWRRVLTDFELISDAPEPNLLRKILTKEAA